jgi:hypothetical protein
MKGLVDGYDFNRYLAVLEQVRREQDRAEPVRSDHG